MDIAGLVFTAVSVLLALAAAAGIVLMVYGVLFDRDRAVDKGFRLAFSSLFLLVLVLILAVVVDAVAG